MTLYHNALALLAAGILFTSCSDAPTGEQTNFWYRFNTAVELQAGRTTVLSLDTSFVSEHATAAFHNPDSLGLIAGDVMFESVPLAVRDTLFFRNGTSYAGRGYEVSSATTSIPLRMAGSLNRFTASGGPNVAALSVNAPSPLRELVTRFPLTGEALSRDSGFTIRWDPSVADSSLIALEIVSLAAGAPNEARIVQPNIADAGTFVVDRRTLTSFPDGPVVVVLRRYRRTTGRLADDRLYDARIYSEVVAFGTIF